MAFLFFGVMAACFLSLNWWCLPAHDELAYAFQGECTPIEGAAHHVASLADVVRSELAEYSHGPSGRVFLHACVQLFAGWELFHLFDALNTLMWFFMTWLVLREGELEMSLRRCAVGAAVVFWFLFYCETCTYNMAFAMNYLWMMPATIFFVRAWRRDFGWWMTPVAFFYGWSQDVFSLAVLGAFGFCGFVAFCRRKRYPWGWARSFAYGALALGVAGCCGSYFLSGRAEGAGAGGVLAVAAKLVHAQASMALDVWPAALVMLVLWLAWKRRERMPALFADAPEWWAIFLFGFLEYAALGADGMRIAAPMFLAGTILLVRNRGAFFAWTPRRAGWLMALTAGWAIVAAALQFDVGWKLERALALYRADPQGVTCRAATPVGPWRASVSPHLFNRWHRALFRHQFGLERQPAFFSPRLHETLYKNPAAFFAVAEEVLPGAWALPGERNYLVVKAEAGPPSPEEVAKLQSAVAERVEPTGWRRILPGRLRVVFPPPDFHVGLPSNPFVFKAADGKRYALVAKSL